MKASRSLRFSRFFRLFSRRVARDALIRIDGTTWNELLDELDSRGQGVRESGAFLLAGKDGDSRRVVSVVYFDDLDEHALTGAIHLHAYAFSRLWRLCRERGLSVICDVHTHPSSWVEQSSIDQANPMVARPGHIGVIVPDFARGSRAVHDVGIHIYRGESGWESHFGPEAAELLYIGRRA